MRLLIVQNIDTMCMHHFLGKEALSVNTSSNEIWRAFQNPEPFESRSHRFREEMRPLFLQWLGIEPDSRVLDGGCGSGVFTRYLAKGLKGGHIVGFDINEGFVAYGKQKAAELGLQDRMTLEVADGFALPGYADDQFDAVTNYTYLGALSDPEAGLRELIRVCKSGGVVSCVDASNAISYAFWQGSYPFDGAAELQRLARIENVIFSSFAHNPANWKQPTDWSVLRRPELFALCGLQNIHVYPFGHLICYNDDAFPFAYRKRLAITETQEEISWLESRYAGKEKIYASHGFSAEDYTMLQCLLARKLDYLEQNFETDKSYEWHGGFNFIVTGQKR